MRVLNFPSYDFRFKNSENNIHIFDLVRKKFVVLQPEEWVRQHIVHYLVFQKKYPLSLINLEKQIKVNSLLRRYDLVVFKPNGSIQILIECKSPETAITQTVFDQIAQYNMQLQSDYLMVSNGLSHFFCKVDFEQKKYFFLKDIPDFSR